MPSPIPASLAPYLHSSLRPNTQTLITSVSRATSPWLTLRMMYAAFYPQALEFKDPTGVSQAELNNGVIIFVSFIRSLSFWNSLGEKWAFDITTLLKSGKLIYVDALNSGNSTQTRPNSSVINVKSNKLSDVRAAIELALQMATTASSQQRTTIIIDSIDFALAQEPEMDPFKLQQFLASIRSPIVSLILSCNADTPLLYTDVEAATTLEKHQRGFLASMAHQSCWVFQIRGLDTGIAKDVTGVLRVSHGGSDELTSRETSNQLSDREWLYRLKSDASISIWLRGEEIPRNN